MFSLFYLCFIGITMKILAVVWRPILLNRLSMTSKLLSVPFKLITSTVAKAMFWEVHENAPKYFLQYCFVTTILEAIVGKKNFTLFYKLSISIINHHAKCPFSSLNRSWDKTFLINKYRLGGNKAFLNKCLNSCLSRPDVLNSCSRS